MGLPFTKKVVGFTWTIMGFPIKIFGVINRFHGVTSLAVILDIYDLLKSYISWAKTVAKKCYPSLAGKHKR